MNFLRQTKPLAASIFLLALIAIFYLTPTSENIPDTRPLTELSHSIGPWQTASESKPDQEILDLLRADDTLTRSYRRPGTAPVSVFIAFFKSQRAGVTPHSPKVCLPGSGWEEEKSDRVRVEVPAWEQPITINRYIVRKGEYRSLVLYWYQTAHRVVANEFEAKIYLVLDGVRYRRSDASLIRIIVPITEKGEELAYSEAVEFIRASFPVVKAHLPG